MEKNILLVGVLDDKVKSLAEALSQRLDKMYLDIDALVDYNLVNKSRLALAGQDYFDKIQQSSIRQANDCTATIASIGLQLYNHKNYASILSSYYVIFVDFSAEQINMQINKIAKDKRLETKNRLSILKEMREYLSKLANLTIKYQSDEQTIDKIIKSVNK